MFEPRNPQTGANGAGDARVSATALRAVNGGQHTPDAPMPVAAFAELAAGVARALDDPALATAAAHNRTTHVTLLSEPLLDADDVATALKIPSRTVSHELRSCVNPAHVEVVTQRQRSAEHGRRKVEVAR
jgi:hypothetical protein